MCQNGIWKLLYLADGLQLLYLVLVMLSPLVGKNQLLKDLLFFHLKILRPAGTSVIICLDLPHTEDVDYFFVESGLRHVF